MSIVQLGQRIEAPAVNPLAEAVRGLARDRSLLVKELRDTNRGWIHFADFAKEQAEKIDKLDKRIDELLSKDATPTRATDNG